MTTPGILFTRSSHFPHKGKAPAQAGAFRLPGRPLPARKGRNRIFSKFIFTKIIQTRRAPGNGRFFVGFIAPLGQRGREGVSTPPPYPLWTPYPPATTRAEPWTQKQNVTPGVWLKKLFTARQMYCASLFPGAIRPALRLCMRALRARLHPTRRTKKNRYTKSLHKQSKHTLHTSTQSNEKKAKTKK